jgi:hypothetical protein
MSSLLYIECCWSFVVREIRRRGSNDESDKRDGIPLDSPLPAAACAIATVLRLWHHGMHMRLAIYLFISCFSVAWVSQARTHHSFGNIYDGSRNVTLTGVVTQFLFVHPHPYLLIDVARAGNRESWRGEMDNRFELADIGVTAETFKPGDRIVVSGSPGRTEERTLYIWKLERPADGLLYEQIGMTPRVSIPRSN